MASEELEARYPDLRGDPVGDYANLEINLPVKNDGTFDTAIMQAWADYSEETENKANEIGGLTA